MMRITKKTGSDRTTSTKRMIRLSTQPPKKPAMAPRVTPIRPMIATAMKPMKSDVCSRLHEAQEHVLADLVRAQSGVRPGRRAHRLGQARLSKALPVSVGMTIARATRIAIRNSAMTARRCWRNRWRTSSSRCGRG